MVQHGGVERVCILDSGSEFKSSPALASCVARDGLHSLLIGAWSQLHKVLGLWDEPKRWQPSQNSNLYHELCQPPIPALLAFRGSCYHIAQNLTVFSLCPSIQLVLFLHPPILPLAKANFSHDWREKISF